jgi:hypothetical protein
MFPAGMKACLLGKYIREGIFHDKKPNGLLNGKELGMGNCTSVF